MEELIKVTKSEKGEQAVNARDLYDYLEIKRDFTNWAKQMFEYGFEEGIDFTPILAKSTGGRPSVDYALTLDTAKEISMLQRTEKGKQARLYFISCEKNLRALAEKPKSIEELIIMQAQSMLEMKNEVSLLGEKVDRISAQIKTRPEYFTIVGYASLNHIEVGLKLASSLGRKASVLCRERGFETEDMPDPRFGRVKTYPYAVLEEVFNRNVTV